MLSRTDGRHTARAGRRQLPLISGLHAYEKAGPRRILVHVIDVFGNHTQQPFDVEVG